MGPRSQGPRKILAVVPDKSHSVQLQWGRDHKDRGSNSAATKPLTAPASFNGAAITRTAEDGERRKQRGDPRMASMGPRSQGPRKLVIRGR